MSGTAKEYLRIMFFVMSYFVVGQAINTTLVVGVFRSGGDTEIRIDSRYDDDVVLLDIVRFSCGICISSCSVPVVYVILMSDEIIKIPIT